MLAPSAKLCAAAQALALSDTNPICRWLMAASAVLIGRLLIGRLLSPNLYRWLVFLLAFVNVIALLFCGVYRDYRSAMYKANSEPRPHPIASPLHLCEGSRSTY